MKIISKYDIDSNAFLKMDCEGCEYDVILNDYEHIKHFNIIYFEILLKEVRDNDACVGGRIITSCKTILCKLLFLWERTYAFSPWRRPRGCALLIRKDVLDEIGGFADVSAPDTHVQEYATKLGYHVRVVSKVKAYHVRKITLKRAVKTQFQTGIARYKQGIGLTRTLLHSIARLRPFVILGYIYALIKDKFRKP